MALYNKWRGQTFDDILGQEHITATLQNQIRAGRIGHAYLFTGLRGTGKTSTARILAKAINCVGGVENPPCNECHICRTLTEGRSLDLVEIDGASNRGVDEIRELRDRVNFSPSECRYKVYVIDEVHMLTREAFNALLKTLEEPPAHVVFVLCTTEPHRLPDTVLSRCQRFDFRRGSLANIMAKLHIICEREGIAIRDDALEFIARRATGSYRDAESLLDQLAAYGEQEITLEQVQAVLGTVSAALVGEVVRALVVGDAPAGLRAVNEAFDGGAEPRQFLSDLLEYLRALMLLRVGGADTLQTLGTEALAELRELAEHPAFSLGMVVEAIKRFTEAGQGLRYAVRPELPVEMALVESILSRDDEREATAGPSAEPEAGRPPAPRVVPAGGTRRTSAERRPDPDAGPAAEQAAAPRSTPTVGPAPTEAPSSSEAQGVSVPEAEHASSLSERPSAVGERPLTLERVMACWQRVLIQIKSRNAQVQALLKSAEPIEVRGSTVVLGCEAEFHRDKLSQDARRALVEEVLGAALGEPCTVQCVVSEGYYVSRGPRAEGAPGDLFEAADPRRAAEQRLLEHPAVKELQRQGGIVRRVHVVSSEEDESHG